MNQRLSAFAFLVVLSGCVDSAPASLRSPEGAAGDFGGAVGGVVVDTEAAPVAGATVAVEGVPPVNTSADGRFVIRGVPPGSQKVFVQALGYSAVAREVDVIEGQTVEVVFQLERLAVEVPRVEVLLFKGFSACDYTAWVVSGRLGPPCDSGQARSRFDVQVGDGFRFLVVEMKWKGGVGNHDSFRLFTADDGDCVNTSPCYGLVYGRGLARLEGEPGKTDLVKYYDPWDDARGPPYPENASFKMVVNGQWIGLLQPELNNPPQVCQTVLRAATGAGYKPGCLGVGVSTGIPYDLYVSIFHWMQPKRGACCPATTYSAIPDN